MIVVFDANIWKTNLYLKSSASAAVKFFLQDHAAKVGLPEVVRLEVERHLRLDIKAMRERITLEHNRLLGLFGRLPEVVLPTDLEIESLVSNIFSHSGFNLQEVPFSEEAARHSFLRTVDKTPPSHKSQQFKDGVIWDDCKKLAETEEVILVTDDRAFYEGDEPKHGLAKVLAEEVKQCRYKLRVLSKLPDLLSELKRPVTVADVVLEAAILTFLQQHVSQLLERAQLAQSSGWRFQKSLFATQYPGSLYVDFIAWADCEDIKGEGRTNAVLQITGDGLYLLADKKLENVQPRELSITYTSPNGVSEKLGSAFMTAHSVMGHRIVTNIVRERLDLLP
jgi:hypothetical protein